MNFNLVYGGLDPGPRIQQLLQMFYAKVADAARPDFSGIYRIFHRAPTLQPSCFASVWAMQEEEVDVLKATRLHGLRDGFSGRFIARIGCQLAGVEDVGSIKTVGIAFARKKVLNRLPDFPFVVVHLCAIKAD